MPQAKAIFISLLALYVLCLSLQPCADEIEHSSTTVSIENHANGTDVCYDFCSPFCVCSCCQCSYMPYTTETNEAYLKGVFVYRSSESLAFTSAFLATVWQPPKV